MNQAPTLGKMKEDKGVITPTLILPPQGGGKMRKRKDGFDESNLYTNLLFISKKHLPIQ